MKTVDLLVEVVHSRAFVLLHEWDLAAQAGHSGCLPGTALEALDNGNSHWQCALKSAEELLPNKGAELVAEALGMRVHMRAHAMLTHLGWDGDYAEGLERVPSALPTEMDKLLDADDPDEEVVDEDKRLRRRKLKQWTQGGKGHRGKKKGK